jgi:hypothetical protein
MLRKGSFRASARAELLAVCPGRSDTLAAALLFPAAAAYAGTPPLPCRRTSL